MTLSRELLLLAAVGWGAFANPYPDPRKVPVDSPVSVPSPLRPVEIPAAIIARLAEPVLRFDVEWKAGEHYSLLGVKKENSGTDNLLKRALKADPLGSYRAALIDARTEEVLFYDSVGTGQEFRKLTRAMTFRFPIPDRDVLFRMTAENPQSGIQETVLQQLVSPTLIPLDVPTTTAKVSLVKTAAQSPALKVNFYAEGYTGADSTSFLNSVKKAIQALQSAAFPDFDRMEFWAVYEKSAQKLGNADDLGLPIAERNSFLGLYFPYWDPFGRWYHIVYPTRERKFRNALATAPYDYPIVLVDDREYWGVGNFNELTAIPAGNSSFTYLLLHEFGHYFGLNEEYEGGGPTELAFAPKITEPWSQNITFHPTASELKWKHLVAATTPLPTPASFWSGTPKPYGAYKGGYADTLPLHQSHKPGLSCTMKNGTDFCPICREAIHKKILFDLGQ